MLSQSRGENPKNRYLFCGLECSGARIENGTFLSGSTPREKVEEDILQERLENTQPPFHWLLSPGTPATVPGALLIPTFPASLQILPVAKSIVAVARLL